LSGVSVGVSPAGAMRTLAIRFNGLVCFIFVIPSDVWAWELA